LPGGRRSRLEDPHALGIEVTPRDLLLDPSRRLVVRLPRETERSPVDAHEFLRAQIDPRLERFFRRDVDRVSELAGRVGADGQRGQIEGAEGVTDLLEVLIVAGVSG